MRKLGACLLLVFFTSLARGSDPSTPRIGPEESPKAKAERLLKALPDAEAQSWRARVESGEVAARDVIHRLLLAKNADYAKAVAEFEKDGSNVEDFQKILATATDPALKAHATYFLGRALLNMDDYEQACLCFDRVKGELANGTPWTDEALLYLGYAYARRPELEEDRARLYKARAQACLDALPQTAPERVKESASWLSRELSGEGSGPLLELARRMETIERSIDHEKTGRPTQKRQEAVISEIDRLIALMKEKEGG
jgi:tetratricopeptide (TPR) repeat protein